MIKLSAVSHQIGRAKILHQLTTTIPPGKLTALIGPNGAGKSTLLRLIGRLEPLKSGHIAIDDLDLNDSTSEQLALKMAILGQQTIIASRLRLSELVGFGRWPHHHGHPCARDHQIIATTMESFGLTTLADRFLDEVSGGQAQRALLAMTFAQDTDWLLLDEPLNNLDMAHARSLMSHLSRAVQQHGKSVVVVVHEVNYAAAWANHIVAVKDGRLVLEGSPQEILTGENLSALYETPVTVTQHKGRPMVMHHC